MSHMAELEKLAREFVDSGGERLKGLLFRYGMAEAASLGGGVITALTLFGLIEKRVLPRDLDPILVAAVLYLGDSVPFLVTNYIIRLEQQRDEDYGSQLPAKISWRERWRTVGRLGVEFGPQELPDILIRGGSYLGIGAVKDQNTFVVNMLLYGLARGVVDAAYYQWPLVFNFFNYSLDFRRRRGKGGK